MIIIILLNNTLIKDFLKSFSRSGINFIIITIIIIITFFINLVF